MVRWGNSLHEWTFFRSQVCYLTIFFMCVFFFKWGYPQMDGLFHGKYHQTLRLRVAHISGNTSVCCGSHIHWEIRCSTDHGTTSPRMWPFLQELQRRRWGKKLHGGNMSLEKWQHPLDLWLIVANSGEQWLILINGYSNHICSILSSGALWYTNITMENHHF